MQFFNGLALLSSLCLYLLPATAVYHDEAYKIDYQHALLGAPVRENSFFYQPTLSSKASLLYTLSEKNVVGAVNPKDGSLVWRQKLAGSALCDQDTPGFLGAANGTNSVISAHGDTVTAWEAASGRQLWSFQELGCVQSLVVPDISGVSQDPVVLMVDQGAMRLTTLNAINGKVVWQVTEDAGDIPLAVAAGSSHIYYVALQPVKSKGYNIKVVSVDAKTARPTGEEIISTSNDITSVTSVLHVAQRFSDPMIFWTDKSQKSIKVNLLGSKSITTLPIPPTTDPIEQITFHVPNAPQALGHFLIGYETASVHFAEVYSLDKATKDIKKTYDLPKVEGPGTFAVSTIGVSVFFMRITKDKAQLHFSSSSQVLESWDLSQGFKDAREASQGISHVAAEVVNRGMSNYALRAATALESDDWLLMRNGESEWVRSESLGGIIEATWADIPDSEDLARELAIESHDNVISAYIHRVTRHAHDLRHLPGWLLTIPDRVRSSISGAEKAPPTEEVVVDSFGFRKLVVVATGRGRMAAIDTNGGQILWNTQVAQDLPADQRWNLSGIIISDNSVIALGAKKEAATIDLMTGSVQKYNPRDESLMDEPRAILASTGKDTTSMLPITANGAMARVPPNAFGTRDYVVTRSLEGDLIGWYVNGGVSDKVWTFPAPEGSRIASISTRPFHDPIASIGRPLGDRNVLYKYLSPNMMLVITAEADASTATVHLLDTVSGSTLYATTHSNIDATKPIAATMSENWFVYTMYSIASPKGYTLTMSELFESPIPNDRGPLGEAGNFSSFSGKMYLPHVESLTFVLPTEISYLTTTSTRQGITPRSLLAYCPMLAAVVAIPVPLLSPRRPVGRDPSTDEREEGLFRYTPVLDLNPAWTISHARDVLGIRDVKVEPTQMESTSLVFAYGDLDVFGTRVAPIGSFDILGKGFGKIQLLLTLMALGVGTSFLAPMALGRQIDTLWKR